MDYARKIGKTEKPKLWAKRPVMPVTTFDSFMSKDEPIAEDSRLLNWKRWLDNRKKQYQRIKTHTGRHQNEQVLNSCEKIRSLIETRNLMDFANVPVPLVPDKYRGGPEFWKTPEILPNRGNVCLPDVFVTPTKKELNEPLGLTYVGLPELIEKEKDLTGLKTTKKPFWERSRYLKSRKEQLAKQIELLQPKKPETENLVIQGQGPRTKPKLIRIPPITITVHEEESERFCQDHDQVIVLKIQNQEITWQRSSFSTEKTDSTPVTWNLTFCGQVDRRMEKTITFENKGNRVIVYQWRNELHEYNTMKFEKRISPFFFNKTKSLVLPGQIVELKIWYLPRIPGVFSESWTLVTDPKVRPSSLIFRFWGCSEIGDSRSFKQRDPRSIDKYLDNRVRNTIIRQVINDILEDVDYTKPPEPSYGSLFLESQIFTSKNPLCFYHPSHVIEFRKLYDSVVTENSSPWSLSLNELREILLKIAKPERRHDMLLQFNQLFKKCLEPSLFISIASNKYEMAYNVLCSFINQFEIESDYTRTTCQLKDCETTMLETDTVKSTSMSQMSVKTNSTRGKRRKSSGTRVQNNQAQETSRSSNITNHPSYGEIFFLRIHEALSITIDRICATIDSFNALYDSDK